MNASGGFGARLRSLPGAAIRNWHITLPILVCVILSAPFIWFLTPSYEPLFADEYQPLKALKFFKSFGQDYHKWGPLTNFLLAPGYAISLGWWYLKGTFSNPTEHFPYGFSEKHAIWQMSILIVQGRALFLAMFAVALGVFGRALHRVCDNKAVIFLTLMSLLAANPAGTQLYADTKPDGPATALILLGLAVYIGIWRDGLTFKRGAWCSLWVVLATTGKELAAMAFIFPYAWMMLNDIAARRKSGESFAGAIKPSAWIVAFGTCLYLALNVVYAPKTWLKRIEFWTTGAGKDSAVWGGGLQTGESTMVDYARTCADTLFNNIGVAGCVVLAIAALALIVYRPRGWVVMTLPTISIFALGLLPMGYVEDRFYVLACPALALPAVLGLGELALRLRSAAAMNWFAGLGAVMSCWFGLLAWHFYAWHFEVIVERYLPTHVAKDEVVNEGATFDGVPHKTRLEYLGYNVDVRSLGHIMQSPEHERPDVIVISRGRLLWVLDALKYPKRAAMMERESGFDVQQWRGGMEGMGYMRVAIEEPRLPAWLPFGWVPAVKDWDLRNAMLVYRKNPAADPSLRTP